MCDNTVVKVLRHIFLVDWEQQIKDLVCFLDYKLKEGNNSYPKEICLDYL